MTRSFQSPSIHRIAISTLAIALGLALCAIPAMAQDWAGRGRANGSVVDANDNPIEGAKVTLTSREVESGPEPIFTDKKGRWKYLGLKQGEWLVKAEAEGYIGYEDGYTVYYTGAPDKHRSVLEDVPEEIKLGQKRNAANEFLLAGNDFAQAGQNEEARTQFEQALEILPEGDHPAILAGIASTYIQEENSEKAIDFLEKALAINADEPQSLKLMIAVLSAEGRDQEAEAFMARLPEGENLDPNTLLNRGIAKYNEGDMDAAAAIFEEVLASHPDMPDAHYFAGLVRLNQGKNEEALESLNKFIELAPNDKKVEEAKQFIGFLAPKS